MFQCCPSDFLVILMGSDNTTITIVPASEIEARVDGGREVREITSALRRFVQSVSRSDRFAAELIAQNTDFSFMARKLHEMLNATFERYVPVEDGETGRTVMRVEQVPDWRTQMQAWREAAKVFGLEFMMPKDPAMNINVNTLAIARDVEGMSIDELKREARAAMGRMKDIDPSVFDVEDAEVEDDVE